MDKNAPQHFQYSHRRQGTKQPKHYCLMMIGKQSAAYGKQGAKQNVLVMQRKPRTAFIRGEGRLTITEFCESEVTALLDLRLRAVTFTAVALALPRLLVPLLTPLVACSIPAVLCLANTLATCSPSLSSSSRTCLVRIRPLLNAFRLSAEQDVLMYTGRGVYLDVLRHIAKLVAPC